MPMHTPGPWTLKTESEHRGGRVRKLQVLAPHGLNGQQEVFCRFGPDDTDKANARLIAAAPEMLAALELIVHRVDSRPAGMAGAMDVREFTAEARAAINNAKGGRQ